MNKKDFIHQPVLLREVLDHLQLRPGMQVIDATLGLGGHSLEILKAIGPRGTLMVFEQDEANLTIAQDRLKAFSKQIIYVHRNFENLQEEVRRHRFIPDAILMDLGLSSPHVDDAERGFSFKKEGPLDMRFDRRSGPTAADLLNRLSEKELADLIFKYGEERQSRKFARLIVDYRKKQKFTTTMQLAELIASKSPKHQKIHPATRVFQALRIAVNRELDVLEKTLEDAINLLKPGGRIAVISYHSLEDRITKQIFRYYTQECICPKNLPVCQCNFQKKLYLITKKPIIPSGIEVLENPRARSAKLRVAQRL